MSQSSEGQKPHQRAAQIATPWHHLLQRSQMTLRCGPRRAAVPSAHEAPACLPRQQAHAEGESVCRAKFSQHQQRACSLDCRTHGHPLATLRLERCMECCCSAFRDVLVLAGLQAGVGREAEALPFRRMRNREGRLFAAKAADVPPVMAAEEALAFPVKLGSLTYRLASQRYRTHPKPFPHSDSPVLAQQQSQCRKIPDTWAA